MAHAPGREPRHPNTSRPQAQLPNNRPNNNMPKRLAQTCTRNAVTANPSCHQGTHAELGHRNDNARDPISHSTLGTMGKVDTAKQRHVSATMGAWRSGGAKHGHCANTSMPHQIAQAHVSVRHASTLDKTHNTTTRTIAEPSPNTGAPTTH